MHLKNAVLVLTLLSFTACTSMRPIEDVQPAVIHQEVEAGDWVEIVATNGKTYDLEVTKVEADALYGEADSGKRYKIPLESIKSIRVEKVSGWKTTGVTLVALYVAAIGLVVYIFSAL